jgi:putative transposase
MITSGCDSESLNQVSVEEGQDHNATRWLWTYNHERPNMGLGGITPMQKLALAA